MGSMCFGRAWTRIENDISLFKEISTMRRNVPGRNRVELELYYPAFIVLLAGLYLLYFVLISQTPSRLVLLTAVLLVLSAGGIFHTLRGIQRAEPKKQNIP